MSQQLTSLLAASSQRTPSPAAAGGPAAPPSAAQALADTGRAARIGLWALGLGFGGFLLWAGFAPLDEGVPSPAQVTIDTKRKPVQHQTGGLIKDVLVREGDLVKEGQTLIRLDDAFAHASAESVRQQYFGLRAMQGRLQAEQAGNGSISFPPDLVAAAKTDPLIAQHQENQRQLLTTRRASLAADLQGSEEAIQGQEAMIKSYTSMLGNRREQLRLLSEELGNTRELVKDGYVPRNRQFELERQVAEVNSSMAELEGNILRGQRSIAETRQRMTVRRQEYRKEVEGLLADVSRQVQADAGKVVATANELQRTEIKAPAAGQVVGLAIQTVGGVIPPGQRVMDIVPEHENLLLEAHVAPHMIDRVRTGMPVDIRFSAFSHSPQLVVEGHVASLAKDLLTDPQGNNPYYLARVNVSPEGMKKLGQRQLQPGMPAEVVFRTGERTMLTYLLQPLTKRLAASMKEE